MADALTTINIFTHSQGVHCCDNEFIKENSDIREFSEFSDIMERVAGTEYAPREGASFLKYVPREGVGGAVVSATSLLTTAPSYRGLSSP